MSPVVLPFCTEHSVELSTVSPSGMEYYKKRLNSFPMLCFKMLYFLYYMWMP